MAILTERNNMCDQMTLLNIWLWNGNTVLTERNNMCNQMTSINIWLWNGNIKRKE